MRAVLKLRGLNKCRSKRLGEEYNSPESIEALWSMLGMPEAKDVQAIGNCPWATLSSLTSTLSQA